MNFLFSCLVIMNSHRNSIQSLQQKISVLVMEIANNNVYTESLSCET